MGANAQTSVPTFTAGDVLTAANMNISARTGVPVFADTTARDAGFGGTGEKTLAEGQLCYLESTNVVQYYDGAAWATVGPTTVSSALTFISATTIGTGVASVAVSNVFSSTYDNYYITMNGGALSSGGTTMNLTFGATTTGYYQAGYVSDYGSATLSAVNAANTTSITNAAHATTDGYTAAIWVFQPNLAKYTWGNALHPRLNLGNVNGISFVVADTTQYTGFTFTPASGTLTGGTIRVYGVANS